MINILKRNKSKPHALENSQLFTEKTFYKTFSKDIKSAKQEMMIESPFVTPKHCKELYPIFRKLIKRGVDIKVYTRIPKHQGDKRQQTIAWQGIEIIKNSGAKVKLCSDMRHRKIAIIDNIIVWEGSLNMLSHSNSKELMRRTSDAKLVRQIKNVIF